MMRPTLLEALGLSLLLACGHAQTIAPSNQTSADGMDDNDLAISFSRQSGDQTAVNILPVLGLTNFAADLSTSLLTGNILLANASSEGYITPDNVVLISCDSYPGFINPDDVFSSAESNNVTAIVLYTEHAVVCSLAGQSDNSYNRVFTLTSPLHAQDMLDTVNSLSGTAFGRVGVRDALGNSTTTSNDGGSNQQTSPLGPSPSTAVAMIILYSITGIITALFLIIIISGAVRAHRHPERYGPRNGTGRPRQSRAKGLARAMLETIPIVKFGDRAEDERKTSDVELARGTQPRADPLPDQLATTAETSNTGHAVDGAAREATATSSEADPSHEHGIAAATTETNTPDADSQGCSICTEDFQVGEDQRVLPCDHRFHPTCIDPWLLNVSGTCPLCRIDLRPQTSRTSVGDDADLEGLGELAPPLEGSRMSVGRNMLRSFLGTSPAYMTREQRVSALRELREQQQAGATTTVPAQGEEEEGRRLGNRLRNAFRVRTRRVVSMRQEGSAGAQGALDGAD